MRLGPPAGVKTGVKPHERSPSDTSGGADSRLDEWRARRDSNSRPSGPQPDALSTELRAPHNGGGEGGIRTLEEDFSP